MWVCFHACIPANTTRKICPWKLPTQEECKTSGMEGHSVRLSTKPVKPQSKKRCLGQVTWEGDPCVFYATDVGRLIVKHYCARNWGMCYLILYCWVKSEEEVKITRMLTLAISGWWDLVMFIIFWITPIQIQQPDPASFPHSSSTHPTTYPTSTFQGLDLNTPTTEPLIPPSVMPCHTRHNWW